MTTGKEERRESIAENIDGCVDAMAKNAVSMSFSQSFGSSISLALTPFRVWVWFKVWGLLRN